MINFINKLAQRFNISRDHAPSRFSVISVPSGGHIALAPCPGMTGDLEQDLDEYENWGATVVVSLVEMKELKKAGAEYIGEELKRRKIHWFHWPIKDQSIPSLDTRQIWLDMYPFVQYRLKQKKSRIVLHCWAGCGRSGMVAAKLLMKTGMSANEAISHIRYVKPDAIDTYTQMQWLQQKNWS